MQASHTTLVDATLGVAGPYVGRLCDPRFATIEHPFVRAASTSTGREHPMTQPPDDDLQVQPRPCGGPAPAGQARHPRPAGVRLEIDRLYACDYGLYAADGRRMVPMDLRPLLDAIAARYAGCSSCERHQTDAVANLPALTTHLVGAALLSLSPLASGRQLVHLLDPPGAAIAVTIRNSGLVAAAEVARHLLADQRTSAVRIALNVLLPIAWSDVPVSNLCPPVVQTPAAALGDEEVLAALRAEGLLPAAH